MAFGGGGSSSSELTAHTHNESLAGDGGQLSQTLTDMNGVTLYSEITDNSAAVAANTAAIAVNTAAIAAGIVPTGSILMWSGAVATIPAGWNICDGTNGTVNLTNKFVRSGTSVGTTGGADTITLTGAQSGLVSHSHSSSVSDGGHTHTVLGGGSSGQPGFSQSSSYGGSGVSTTSSTTGIGVSVNSVSASDASSSHDNMPSYYELAYIQKV
jgi:microcystin-dependent protein|tara:strand:- start:284 stop:919 length:636 start_codon:yes stop_codon:yes gene_type:complete